MKRIAITYWLLPGIISVSLIASAARKLFALPESQMWAQFDSYGLLGWMIPIALLELLAVLLFLFPKTSPAGYVVLMAFLGGAIATKMVYKEDISLALLFIIGVTAAQFLRKPEMFTKPKIENTEPEIQEYAECPAEK